MNKVMRYQIIKPIDMDWKTFGDILNKLRQEVRFTKNKTIALYNDWITYSLQYKEEHGNYPKLIDCHGYKIFAGYAYDTFKNDVLYSNTSNYTNSIREACSAYDTNKVDIIKGNCAVPNMGTNQPIDLHNKSLSIEVNDTGDYIATLSLLSNKGKKEFGLRSGQIKVLLKTGNKSSKDILQRCVNGEYKICASKIIYNNKKTFINLCYGFDSGVSNLDDQKIMGVDLGIAVPAYMAFNFDKYKRDCICDNRIMTTKWMMDQQLSLAKQSCKYLSNGNSGRGRKKKMVCYDKYSNKSRNLSQTINHGWSKYIVDVALKNGCGAIQMEDLSGVTADKDKFLKNWTFYDLQQKIEYKAKEKGIKVVRVNPKYTSQRCSECGCICRRNRPDQKTFKCVRCGYSSNADFNAAKNIATIGIEDIISRTEAIE